MKSLDHGDAAMFSNDAEAVQDALLLAPFFFEVVALQFASLIDNQMFWLGLLSLDDLVESGSYLCQRSGSSHHGPEMDSYH